MRIIHTGDLHLESSLKTNLDIIKRKERREELLSSFSRLIDYANKNNVQVIIIAGDMFDSSNITKKAMDYIIKSIKNASNIDFIYVSGNHDDFLVFDKLNELPSNLRISTNNWNSYQYDDTVITGINFNTASEKHLYDTLKLDPNNKNIVVMHGEVSDYSDTNKINIKRLANKGIDYLALGHIHKMSTNRLDSRGIYNYCGCLEGRGFDEDGEKGFFLIDTKNIKNPQFILFSLRTIHLIELSITDSNDWSDFKLKLNKELSSFKETDIVKVIITGKYKMDFYKHTSILEEELKKRFYFARIEDKSKMAIDMQSIENDISLKAAFIKAVKESEYSEDDKEEIIGYGISALLGDDF